MDIDIDEVENDDVNCTIDEYESHGGDAGDILDASIEMDSALIN